MPVNTYLYEIIRKLNALFKFIINRFTDIYEKKKESLKLTSYSNFFNDDGSAKDVLNPLGDYSLIIGTLNNPLQRIHS